jgi:glycosyltransferase involved in cell wall biosynthesis
MNFFYWFWAFCIVAGILYSALIIWFLNGWLHIPVFKRKKELYKTKVSVIVPFYNEQKNIEKCIKGLVYQDIKTTELEIILIDDKSTDKSAEIVKKYAEQYRRIKYVLNTGSKGKKYALLKGISESAGELIVTTDADCLHNKYWLASIVEYYETYNPNMIVGAVNLQANQTLFQKFQQIEFAALVATGAGAVGINHPIMCNGANLAFKKSVFLELKDPYNIKYQSGDDVFLLHKFKNINEEKIQFLKNREAVVLTKASPTVKHFFKQRFRWVSKAGGYTDSDTKFTELVVSLSTLLWIGGLFLISVKIDFWQPVVFLLGIRIIINILFLKNISVFFATKVPILLIPFFEIFYGIYVSITIFYLLFNKKNRI